MDIDYSLNAIPIRKTGFFYEGERKALYSDFKKPTDTARRNKCRRQIMKNIYEFSKERYDTYLRVISVKMARGEFPPDAPKADLMEEALLGVRDGKITPQILVRIRTGEITRKTIRDELVKSIVEDLGWRLPEDSDDHPTDTQQSGSKSISASGIGDKETQV